MGRSHAWILTRLSFRIIMKRKDIKRMPGAAITKGAVCMILTRFSSSALIRASAALSVLMGLLYLSTSNLTLSITGLGPELAGGQQYVNQWSMYAIYGGICMILGSFLPTLNRSLLYKRAILSVSLLAVFLLFIAQLPPLFWWTFVGGAVISWSSVLFFSFHLSLLVIALWGVLVTIHAIERLK